MISLDRYRTFLAVAQSASISKASALLGISQPAVSQGIRQLEGQLSCRLFQRSPRGVKLTQEGEALLPFATQALSTLAHAERHFEALRSLETGTLRIGASDTLSRHWLLSRLARFHAGHPGIAIQVTNRTSRETVALLEKGQVELGLVNLPVRVPESFVVQQVLSIQDCFFYLPEAFPGLPDALSMQALCEYPLILLEQASATRRYLDGAFAAQGVALRPEIELGSLDLLLDFARAGLGICSGVAEFAGTEESRGLRRLHITPALSPRAIGLIYQRHLPLSLCAQAFLQDYCGPEKEVPV